MIQTSQPSVTLASHKDGTFDESTCINTVLKTITKAVQAQDTFGAQAIVTSCGLTGQTKTARLR